jgi:GMP synthase (glutamine-hydrolysing)
MTTPDSRTALVLRTGDAIPEVREAHGEFAGWIARTTGDAWAGGWGEHDARDVAAALPDPSRHAAIVITGSSSSVTERASWMLRAEGWLREAAALDVPIFGICFGHQLLGQAFGGEVAPNPRGREIGSVRLDLAEGDALFDGLGPSFLVNATHVDTVARLPRGGVVLGSTDLERHAVLAIGSRVRGVQFHPEIDGALMRGYVAARSPAMRAEGLDAEAIASACADTPSSAALLRNFFRNFVTR